MSAKRIFVYGGILLLISLISVVCVFLGLQWARVVAFISIFGGALVIAIGLVAMASGGFKKD